MRQRETATHGQQRGRRQRGEGLAVNTDGIIICVSVVCEKASQHWEGGAGRGKESGSTASGRMTSGTISHSSLVTFFGFLFVSGGIARAVGELSDGNTDINLP